MGVKASPDGIKAMGRVIDVKNLSRQGYSFMSADLFIGARTISDFVKGKAIRKDNALTIINHLGLKREEIVPDAEWYKGTADESVSLDELWGELYQLAKHAPLRLQMVPAVEETAAFNDKGKGKYLTEIVAESKVWIDLDVQQSGYLILLDVDSTGEVTCLSPSDDYIPEYQVKPGIERLPQKTAVERVFQPSTLGKEILLAAILPEEPGFDWLTGGDCQVLDAVQLGELVKYVKASKKPVDLIRSSMTIVSR